ncbi:MAG: UDP-forming cellulose synthase catalytic subunit, partial [Myxococcales bacterium]|nr:UDP-forming cellulose synthase catalytic subunit [Myxococcales bacterium]
MTAAEETIIARRAKSPDPTGLYAGPPGGIPGPARWLIWLVVWAMIAAVALTPLDVHGQAIFGATVFVMAWLLARIPGRFVSLALIIVSVAVSSRYITWRVTRTIGISEPLDLALGLTLLAAELYAYVVLMLGYVQGAWPMRRKPVPLSGDPETWPTVDIYIPTYNEPLDVVKAAIIAAKNQDWPESRFRVYLLDDGRRPEFRAYCEKVGVSYVTRPDNKHAKAGNINHALKKTRGDFVAIFDCDHIPTRSFLQLAMGWLQRDDRMAMVQTPHHFHSPDPFERNLRTFRRVPNEGELFYGMLQRGNDLWNATFFCGSCAVIRRAPLEEIGGIAPETVTEDAHTMLKLHRRGYSSAYLDVPQASGLATESLSAHIGQRIRWARGMTQIFRIDNPLFGRGLKMTQRLCYAAAMVHFLYGIPRLIFLTAPLAFLLFDAHIFNASAPLIVAYALPHLAHAILTNSRLQGDHRHSFWAEVYESVLAFYLTIPTTLALISPKLGKFNVTAKGGVIATSYFDLRIAAPYLVLLGLNLAGAIYGVLRIVNHDVQLEAVAVNLAWTGYNLIMIAAALAVAWETRQRRAAPRVEFKAPAMLWLPDGKVVSGETVDLTMKGAAVRFAGPFELDKGEVVELAVADGEELPVKAEVVRQRAGVLHLQFLDLELPQEEALVRAIYGRPEAWLTWRAKTDDQPLGSFGRILGHGVKSLAKLPRILSSPRPSSKGVLLAATTAGLLGLGGGPARAQGGGEPAPVEPT